MFTDIAAILSTNGWMFIDTVFTLSTNVECLPMLSHYSLMVKCLPLLLSHFLLMFTCLLILFSHYPLIVKCLPILLPHCLLMFECLLMLSHYSISLNICWSCHIIQWWNICWCCHIIQWCLNVCWCCHIIQWWLKVLVLLLLHHPPIIDCLQLLYSYHPYCCLIIHW